MKDFLTVHKDIVILAPLVVTYREAFSDRNIESR